MREILFRGKDFSGVINHSWCFGSLDTIENDRAIIIYSDRFGNKCRIFVDPSTIGEYTGLKDKNGKKIFEGDIIKYKNTDGIKFNGVALTVIGKVVYNEKNASFAISGKDEIGAKHYDYFPIKNIEVIGNIFDNPEILKG